MTTRRKALLALTGVSAMASWHKPIITSIVTPVHAQMSPMDDPALPEEVCPMITFGNVTSGSVSGTNAATACNATFEILSTDAAAPLMIVSIDSTTAAGVTIEVQSLGVATDSFGPLVSWVGPSVNAQMCSNPQPIPVDDITFTITATCDAAAQLNPVTFTQDLSLSQILAG